ncbi:hypothetical protein ACWDBD_04835 [Streptomyces sp. NPDC001118]
MRVRRALAIVIATPVLLAAIGMTGASAATPQKPTTERSIARPEPAGGSRDGEGKTADSAHGADHAHGAPKKAAEQEEPEEGLLGTIAGELFDRVSPVRT